MARIEENQGLYDDVGVPGRGTAVLVPIDKLEGGVADLGRSQ